MVTLWPDLILLAAMFLEQLIRVEVQEVVVLADLDQLE